jgi:hypothetical protein
MTPTPPPAPYATPPVPVTPRPTPKPATRPGSSRSRWIWLLLGLAACLCLAIAGGTALLLIDDGGSKGSQITVVVSPEAQATLAPTLPPLPTESKASQPPPTPIPPTEFPTVVFLPFYIDDLSDPGSGWDVYYNETSQAGYQNGEFRIGVYEPETMYWSNPSHLEEQHYVEVEVEARQVEGPLDNNFGLLLAYQDEGDSFLWFQISGDGWYSVDAVQGDYYEPLVEWDTSEAINIGLGATNLLSVFNDGDLTTFYVNDFPVAELPSTTWSPGNVGLAVGTFDEPGAVVHFDNFLALPAE